MPWETTASPGTPQLPAWPSCLCNAIDMSHQRLEALSGRDNVMLEVCFCLPPEHKVGCFHFSPFKVLASLAKFRLWVLRPRRIGIAPDMMTSDDQARFKEWKQSPTCFIGSHDQGQ